MIYYAILSICFSKTGCVNDHLFIIYLEGSTVLHLKTGYIHTINGDATGSREGLVYSVL